MSHVGSQFKKKENKKNNFQQSQYLLNASRANCVMKAVLIFGFCSVKQMKVFDPPWMGH